MQIKLSEPDGPYSCDVDTGVMRVDIREAFIGPTFITEDAEQLVVIMRDGGFEVRYASTHDDFPPQWFAFQNGNVTPASPVETQP